MNKLAKTLVITGMILVFFILFAVISGSRQASGHRTPGMVAFILMSGLVAGIWAVCKSKPNKKDNDEHHLQK